MRFRFEFDIETLETLIEEQLLDILSSTFGKQFGRREFIFSPDKLFEELLGIFNWVNQGYTYQKFYRDYQDYFNRNYQGYWDFFRNYTRTQDPYTVLGVSPTASNEEIKKAYREKAKRYHPDSRIEPNEERFKEINNAFEQIKKARGFS